MLRCKKCGKKFKNYVKKSGTPDYCPDCATNITSATTSKPPNL